MEWNWRYAEYQNLGCDTDLRTARDENLIMTRTLWKLFVYNAFDSISPLRIPKFSETMISVPWNAANALIPSKMLAQPSKHTHNCNSKRTLIKSGFLLKLAYVRIQLSKTKTIKTHFIWISLRSFAMKCCLFAICTTCVHTQIHVNLHHVCSRGSDLHCVLPFRKCWLW